MDEITYLLSIAVDRLGGELRVSEGEWLAFGASDKSMTIHDEGAGGDFVVTVQDSALPEGVIIRETRDGKTTVVMEDE